MHRTSQILDPQISQIAPNLYAGPLPVAKRFKSGILWDALDGLIDVTLSLEQPFGLPPEGITVVAEHTFSDLNDPVRSGIDLERLEVVVSALDGLLRSGRRVYVHCQMGVSRTGLVLTAHRMAIHREGWAAALSELRKQRPNLDPTANSHFMALLVAWEQALGAHPFR